MSNTKPVQVTGSPAEVYDEFFVPALFQQWGDIVANTAEIKPGQRVLDVACGTGVLTRAAAERLGNDGTVVGLDPNDDMLTVARRSSANIEWQKGSAESLPFPDDHFDTVISQFGLMFFDDPHTGLREMYRVLRPDGRLVVCVCDAIDHSPGYAVLAELLHRLFGEPVAEAFRAPFVYGDRQRLLDLCSEAGIASAECFRHDGSVHFASIESLVSTERACVWTLGGLLNDGQFERLLTEAEESLQPFVTADGNVSFLMPALIIKARKE